MNTMDALKEFCKSDDLSLAALREKISQLSTDDITQETYNKHPFLHSICMNEKVTFEMVKLIIDSFPCVASWHTANYHDRITPTYALHCACKNEHCPSSVIELLVKEHKAAAECLTRIFNSWHVKGLPLHYYMARTSNIDINIVKLLVEAYPDSLMITSEEYDDEIYYPIHAAVCDSNGEELHKIIHYLLEFNSASLRVLDGDGNTPLHLACENERMTLSLVQLLISSWPEAIRMTGSNGWLPIHVLCHRRKLEDTAAISILRFMLSIDSTVVRERGSQDFLPIHYAVGYGNKSFEFCKVLINTYPESLRVAGRIQYDNLLPIHKACGGCKTRDDIIDTIQYMLELDPESINERDKHGRLPIHIAATYGRAKTIELLLKHDPDAASKSTNQPLSPEEDQQFPLHIACYSGHLEAVKVLYDILPQAISGQGIERILLDLARKQSKYQSTVEFLEVQRAYAWEAKDSLAMHTLDHNGWLPLHHALKDKAPLGTIKLLLVGNPSAVRKADNQFAFPLHIACEFSSVNVVRYLVERDVNGRVLEHNNANKDSILHYACRGGNLEVIKYLLGNHASLVSSAVVNRKGELPIHLLCEAGKDDEVDNDDSTEYVETIWRMILANPEAIMS